jgi:prevent-host-death family protein
VITRNSAIIGPPLHAPRGYRISTRPLPAWIVHRRVRAVAQDGPQVITRHGDEVAVVIDIAEYHRLTRPAVDFMYRC